MLTDVQVWPTFDFQFVWFEFRPGLSQIHHNPCRKRKGQAKDVIMFWIDPQAEASKTGVVFFHSRAGPDAAEKSRSAKRRKTENIAMTGPAQCVKRMVFIWRAKFGKNMN